MTGENHHNSPQPAHSPDVSDTRLAYTDAAALDALMHAGLDLDEVSPSLRERAARALELLNTLPLPESTIPTDADRLLQAAMARVNELRFNPELSRLSPHDEDALEALVQHGMDPARVATGMRDRATAQHRVLSLLETSNSSSKTDSARRDDLIARSLATIQSAEASQRSRLTLANADRPRPRRTWRLADLVTAAAMLLVGSAVVLPVASHMRESGRQTACAGNMSSLASAFGLYAKDERDALPMASASLGGTPWWNVGTPAQSNSANLYTLTRTGHAKLEQTACKGNSAAVSSETRANAQDWARFENVSYSFLNLFGRPAEARGGIWHAARPVVLVSDRSSVVVNARAGKAWIDVMENSPNHAGAGQVVLLSDGSAKWLTNPMITPDDNIWLPASLEQAIRAAEQMHRGGKTQPLRGTEIPSHATDSFMCP